MNELVIIPRSLKEQFTHNSSEDLVKVFEKLFVRTTVYAVDNYKYFVYNESPANYCDLVKWAEDEDIMLAENLPQIIYLIEPSSLEEDGTVSGQEACIEAVLYFVLGVCAGALHRRARVSDYIPRIVQLGNETFVHHKFEELAEEKNKSAIAHNNTDTVEIEFVVD